MADPAESTAPIAEDPDELRAALIDQLAYLIHEVEALKPIVDRVPESVRTGRPTPDDLTMKEIYGVIALMDERVYRPRLKRITADDEEMPSFEPVETRTVAEAEAWNEMPMEDILDRVQSARRSLVALLEDLPAAAWSRAGQFGGETRDVYAIAHRITQGDTERLRTLGYRLHETNLTERDRDLPK